MSRPIWQRFESVLADPITRYLAAKRSMGCRFNTEDRALRLDRYLTDQGVQRIDEVTSECLEAFLASLTAHLRDEPQQPLGGLAAAI